MHSVTRRIKLQIKRLFIEIIQLSSILEGLLNHNILEIGLSKFFTRALVGKVLRVIPPSSPGKWYFNRCCAALRVGLIQK